MGGDGEDGKGATAGDLRSLLSCQRCPTSSVRARVRRVDPSTGEAGRGVSRGHFEALHARLCQIKWKSCSEEWGTQVEYEVKDGARTLWVHYSDDPVNVACEERDWVGPPLQLGGLSQGAEELCVTLGRKRVTAAAPPDGRRRYRRVRVRNYKTFIRSSGSVSAVQWRYTLAVEWAAHCLNDAYGNEPSYLVGLEMDASLMPAPDPGMLRWMEDNMMAKLCEMCFCGSLLPARVPIAAPRERERNDEGTQPRGDCEGELMFCGDDGGEGGDEYDGCEA